MAVRDTAREKSGQSLSMTRKFFGTDGIRGRTNEAPMTAAMAQRIGQAAGAHFLRGDHRHRVVIGKDTRLSGYMMETALISGFTSVGMDVVMVGPVPTPAVAMLTHSMRADLGVMISASHNKFVDNGIKLFGPDGYKLSDKDELAIEALLEKEPRLVPAEQIGRVAQDRGRARPLHPRRQADLPQAFAARRAQGRRRLRQRRRLSRSRPRPCGSSARRWSRSASRPTASTSTTAAARPTPSLLKRSVIESGADIGLALDGDADRLIVVDEEGETVDGDQLMALIGSSWHKRGRLRGGGVVSTVMSNLGLERFLGGQGLKLERTQVGDRYVLEAMRAKGYNVGGEQSGHIILTDYAHDRRRAGRGAAGARRAGRARTGRRASC